jgi:hypothetical protein
MLIQTQGSVAALLYNVSRTRMRNKGTLSDGATRRRSGRQSHAPLGQSPDELVP